MTRARVVAVAVVSLVGCRGVIGIEDLTVASDAGSPAVDGGSAADATLESGSDASITDATTDTASPTSVDSGNPLSAADGSDAKPPTDSGAYSNPCLGPDAGGGCRQCCHTTFPAGSSAAVSDIAEAGCLCESTSCFADAGCAGSCSMVPAPSMACGMCIDITIYSMCSAGQAACKNDPTCNEFLQCFTTCPPPPDGGP